MRWRHTRLLAGCIKPIFSHSFDHHGKDTRQAHTQQKRSRLGHVYPPTAERSLLFFANCRSAAAKVRDAFRTYAMPRTYCRCLVSPAAVQTRTAIERQRWRRFRHACKICDHGAHVLAFRAVSMTFPRKMRLNGSARLPAPPPCQCHGNSPAGDPPKPVIAAQEAEATLRLGTIETRGLSPSRPGG